MTDDHQSQTSLKKPTLLQVFGSVLSAIFGVQNSKNRERDFAKGDPKQFAVVYVVIVISIVLCMIALVRTVLYFAVSF
jgi:hypothetical protein